MSERILAVVVTYNPEPNALSELIQATIDQVDQVLVVDNASNNFKALTSAVSVIEFEENKGLGAAHNVGIDLAIEQGYDYILLLDQDSVPQQDMVTKLVAAHRTSSVNNKVSAVGASYINQNNKSQSFFIRFGKLKFQRFSCAESNDNVIAADFLISSGSLISIDSLNEIGKMDEGLFIDHVDTEWFLRAKSIGFQAYGACDAKMKHGLGEVTHRIKLLRERNVPQHKPFRYYYIFRNSILLYKRAYCSGLWKWNDVQRLLSIAVMYGVFVPPRLAHLKMMVKGIKDGLLGRTGPI